MSADHTHSLCGIIEGVMGKHGS